MQMTMEQYFELEGYRFLMTELNCSPYEDEVFKGIVYSFEEARYDIFLNKSVNWARIFINYQDGSHRDLPLNDGTIQLLPDCMKAEKINARK